MAATVDNLESHHSYRVIRGFSDANGVHVPFDSVGVIRHIDISDDWTQIIIDWEQNGQTQKLVFLMAATDGPATITCAPISRRASCPFRRALRSDKPKPQLRLRHRRVRQPISRWRVLRASTLSRK